MVVLYNLLQRATGNANIHVKSILSYAADNIDLRINTETTVNDPTADIPAVTTLRIGHDSQGSYLGGVIKDAKISAKQVGSVELAYRTARGFQ